jgi:hypothetical protein
VQAVSRLSAAVRPPGQGPSGQREPTRERVLPIRMDISDFLDNVVDHELYNQTHSYFWASTVVEALQMLGSETEPDLERLIRLILDYHSGKAINDETMDGIGREIVRLKGVGFWGNTTPLGLKYRCINAFGGSHETKRWNDNWLYGIVTAIDLINLNTDKDKELIALIRGNAAKNGIDLKERKTDQ